MSFFRAKCVLALACACSSVCALVTAQDRFASELPRRESRRQGVGEVRFLAEVSEEERLDAGAAKDMDEPGLDSPLADWRSSRLRLAEELAVPETVGSADVLEPATPGDLLPAMPSADPLHDDPYLQLDPEIVGLDPTGENRNEGYDQAIEAPGERFPRWRRFRSRFFGPPIDGRHRGRGFPLERESWLNRPFHVGGFAGGFFADDPIAGRIRAGDGFMAGGRVGWDWHHFWGFEARLARSTVAMEDPRQRREMGDLRAYLGDIDLLYYPFGDARWRPYMSLGMGFTDLDLIDDLDRHIHETVFSVPLGGGVKYRFNERLAFRLDLFLDFAATASARLDGMANVGLSCGLEYRLGGLSRRTYFPWNASRGWW